MNVEQWEALQVHVDALVDGNGLEAVCKLADKQREEIVFIARKRGDYFYVDKNGVKPLTMAEAAFVYLDQLRRNYQSEQYGNGDALQTFWIPERDRLVDALCEHFEDALASAKVGAR